MGMLETRERSPFEVLWRRSMCRILRSIDFLDMFLPYPALSLIVVGVAGFTKCLTCDIGSVVSGEYDDAIGFRDTIIFSTALVPLAAISLGLLSSLPPFLDMIELAELYLSDVETESTADRPLAWLGEHDCLVDTSGAVSDWLAEDVITLAVTVVVPAVDDPALEEEPTDAPLEFEVERVERLVLRFGGGSKEKPGIADNCCHA